MMIKTGIVVGLVQIAAPNARSGHSITNENSLVRLHAGAALRVQSKNGKQ
jgi:hypothetical protein